MINEANRLRGQIGISKQVAKAVKFAEAIDHNKKVFVRLALQDQVETGGLKLKVSVADAA